LVRGFVRAIEGDPRNSQTQIQLLGAIDDHRAAHALREALKHANRVVRRRALQSLGWSGDRGDVGLLGRLLDDEDSVVRDSARAALADLGGDQAVDVLFASLDGLPDVERGAVQAALAWLGDVRDLDCARELAVKLLRRPKGSGGNPMHGGLGSIYAVLRVGSAADRQLLVDTVLDLIDEAEIPDPARYYNAPGIRRAQDARMQLGIRLRASAGVVEAETLDRWFSDRLRARLPRENWRGVSRELDCDPVLPRSVPRLTLRSLGEHPPANAAGVLAKFGGQPDWIADPTWPLGPGGEPMVLLAELPLIGDPPRVAYVFFSHEGNTWEPLGDGSAVVVQPGAPPQVPTRSAPTGPKLYEEYTEPHRYRQVRKRRPFERFITLEPGADPPEWSWPELPDGDTPREDPGDWGKIGGTPLFLQGEDCPPGDGWHFAFQFNAQWAGHEFGDGAECYGFVHNDGRGAFLWQCH